MVASVWVYFPVMGNSYFGSHLFGEVCIGVMVCTAVVECVIL